MGFQEKQTVKDMPTWTNNDYTKEWKEIENLENDGLPKSALEKVNLIYQKAKKDKNTPQIVKSLIYRVKYTSQLEEDGMVLAIANIQEEIGTADFPEKPLLQSILAELYRTYLDNNYWQFSDRTNTQDFQTDDIRTWSIEQLTEAANNLYLTSVQDDRSLNITLDRLEAILNKGDNAKGLRPTLYDLLAHRAIDYFRDTRTYLTEPAYKFNIEQAEAFAPVAQFVQTSFETKDTSSTKWNALQLFQDLLRLKLKDYSPEALIDADLKRLQFAFENAVNLPKDSLYQTALDDLFTKHQAAPIAAEIAYRKAKAIYDRATQFQNNSGSPMQWAYREAHELCQQIIKQYPGSFGAKNCASLISSIEFKSVGLNTEEVYLPESAILAKISYKNIQKVFLKVVKISASDSERLEFMNTDERVKWLEKQKYLRRWSERLPAVGDFREHSVEIAIDALPLGQYALLISDNDKFQSKKGVVGLSLLNISNLSYLHRMDVNGQSQFLVINRKTGDPIEGVKAELYTQEYNRQLRRSESKRIGQVFSDKNGIVQIDQTQLNYFQVKFSKNKDQLFFKDGYSNYSRRARNEKRIVTHFFLDRAIYRPGQTVYFKGLVVQPEEKQPSIKAGQKVSITLVDANRQAVDSLSLVTNEYGTVNGAFQIPKGGLNGRMRLVSSLDGNKEFRVEEYKRPRFEVNFDPLDGTFNLGDEISVSGIAKAYAGSSIDGAEVRYRVVREVRFPWYYRGGFFPSRNTNMEITNGTTKTDAEGKFQIAFNAIPDPEQSSQLKPLYNFTIYADVTDVAGETRSGNKSVKVGALSLLIDAKVPGIVDQSQDSFALFTTNLDGNMQATIVEVEVFSLDAPKQTFLKRYWNEADQYILSESEFRRKFPQLAYKEEDKKANWPIATSRAQFQVNTATQKAIALDMQSWPVGEYKIILKAKDNAGRAVEQEKFFSLMSQAEQQLPASMPFWSSLDKSSYQPGTVVKLDIAFNAYPNKVFVELEKGNAITNSQWYTIAEWTTLQENITEEDRGNFHWHISYVKDNRAFTHRHLVVVPWTNKELQLEFSSFRNKVLPGSEEEWTVKITGAEKEAVAAEMVAAMYDASLDAFVSQNWSLNLYPSYSYPRQGWSAKHFNSTNAYMIYAEDWWQIANPSSRVYPSLNWFGYDFWSGPRVYARSFSATELSLNSVRADDGAPLAKSAAPAEALESDEAAGPPPPPPPSEEPEPEIDLGDVPVRTNLDETVFFMPNLMTDEEGNVLIKFKMNEALTRWKFLGLAHTKDLKIGQLQEEILTQKDLMVQPNAPRFVREGDQIKFTAKVSNMTERVMNGQAQLLLFDATTNQSVDALFEHQNQTVDFSVEAGQSAPLSWTLKIPEGQVTALTHRVVAKSGNFSDGEESAIPVLTNKMLVTESMPLAINGKSNRTFVFDRMNQMSTSSTLRNHKFTLEFTSNPAWYAVQALPYLMEYPYDCTEQIFNRYYANSLATNIANSHPEIKAVFDTWKDTEALESNLSKNEELKSLLLKETPWVFAAENEAIQKKNIALLFDLTRMADEQASALQSLVDRQGSNGGFSWFPGGRESWYITQYLVEGFGHLNQLGVQQTANNTEASTILNKAIAFIDTELMAHYRELEKRVEAGKAKWKDDHLNNMVIHYLYTRSFFRDRPLNPELQKMTEYYQGQAEAYWLKKGLYQQGLIALALNRANLKNTPQKIVNSLKERALQNEELGMYWKFTAGYYWHELPIETHTLLTEVFAEVAKDELAVQELKKWLLKNKQTNAWKTTKATAAAIYALLNYGDNWILESEQVEIRIDKARKKYAKKIEAAQENAEAGTGYFKVAWEGAEVAEDMSQVKVKNPNKGIAWGSAYWQYFEQLDKISTFEETPLQLKKQLFKEVPTDRGPELQLIDGATLKQGDKVVVRIELRVDRAMEYVHMKDMRASGLEPINVLSQYKWQGGLGYYESTGDAATNFFFSYLPKGTYVFEYPLRVFHEGEFSNGVATIQCMYAPEFTSHSEGERITVE